MGFGGDIAGEATSVLIRVAIQVFAAIANVFARLLGRPPKNIKKIAEKAEFEAKYPIANERVTSPKKHGVFFGRQYNKYIIKPEDMDGHVLVVGGTGTGKSSCVAIPTLQTWQGSIFAVDIKGELHENTKTHRENIKVFDPCDQNGKYVYDPYFFLNHSTNHAQEARAIAESIIPLPHDAREPFWIESAQIILTGAILHYHHAKYNFINTLKEIQSQNPQALIALVASSPNDKAKLCVKSYTAMEGKVLAGISAEISRGISAITLDDDIISVLSPDKNKETLSPVDLENKHDIYIKIPQHLLRQWKNFLTLMVNQFITFFEKRPESKDNRPILFMLDEFPRLGKIPAITDALATLRSKKITVCLVAQSLAQLEMIYGHDARKVIADNCAFKAVLGATDADTQEYFSKLVGTYPKTTRTSSQNFDPYVGAPTGHGASYAEDHEKRIIKPEEFAALKEIILLYPMPLNFCRVQKQPHYHETKQPSV